MSDDNTGPSVDDIISKVSNHISDSVSKMKGDITAEHKSTIENMFRDLKNNVEDTIRGMSTSDKAEREALKEQVSRIDEFIKGMRDSKDDTSGKSTIVVPASGVVDTPPDPQLEESNAPRRKSGWKRFW